MSHLFRRVLPLMLSCCALAAVPAAASAASTVHVRGTAYEFNNVRTMLAGGVVKVAEYPNLQAPIATDGTYDIAVPDKKKVTLYAVATGYHSIYTQTFTTAGADLENVNLQTPTDTIYKALTVILDVPLDAAGNPQQCAIVSTFSTKNVRDLSYQDFIAYGAHGVAGATASGSPALPPATYFNENVVPDKTKTESSKDGGVVWTRVPTGVYKVSASHPTARFATFDATCVPGRVVNANPPWGLHELASVNPATAKATWKRSGKAATVRSLKVSGIPAQSSVGVRCVGPKCSKVTTVLNPTGASLDVRKAISTKAATLKAGQQLEVAVRTHAVNGKVFRWTVGAKGTPKLATLCLPLGDGTPVKTCK